MTFHRLRLASLVIPMVGSALYGSIPLYEEPNPIDFHAYAGFRQDQFDFSIQQKAEHKHHRKRLNEAQVKWKSLNIAQIGAILDYSTYNHYCFKASADYGMICSGRADIDTRFHYKTLAPKKENHHRHRGRSYRRARRHEKKDYRDFRKNLYAFEVQPRGKSAKYGDAFSYDEDVIQKQNHKDRHRRRLEKYRHHTEVSEQTASASDGNVADLSAAIGWKVITDSRRSWVSGLLGWSGHAQDLHVSGAYQKEDSKSVIGHGPIKGLSGKLNARWQGPWVGFDFVSLVDYNVTVYGSGEWHWASYEACGDWKFGSDYCASIRQRARGYGIKGTLGVDWNFCYSWTLGLIGNFQRWSTKSGSNRNRISHNTLPSERIAFIMPVIEKSALRRVTWISFSVSAQLAYRF